MDGHRRNPKCRFIQNDSFSSQSASQPHYFLSAAHAVDQTEEKDSLQSNNCVKVVEHIEMETFNLLVDAGSRD